MKKIDFVKQKIPFTQVANGVLYDKNLSLGAKTIYAFMYSKPDGWDFSAERIGQELSVSKTTALKHLKELKDCGYLLSQKLANGRMLYKVIFPPTDPESKIYALGQKPKTRKATVQKSHGAESSPISNKEVKVIKSISNKESKAVALQTSEVIKSFEKINPACKNFYKNTTQRKAVTDLVDAYGEKGVRAVIEFVLPETNKRPYFPAITTPLQLWQKWAQLKARIESDKLKTNKYQVSEIYG